MASKQNKEDIQAILSDLRKVLEDLTKDEKEQAEEAKKAPPAPPAAAPVPPEKQAEEKPVQEKPVPVPVEKAKEEPAAEQKPEEKITEEKLVPEYKPEPAEIQESPKTVETPEPKTESVIAPEEPAVISPAAPAEPAQEKQEEAPVEPPAPRFEPKELAEPEFIPQIECDESKLTCPVVKFAIFYPRQDNTQDLRANFARNFSEIIKKTTKKPFYFKKIIEYFYNTANELKWDDLLNICIEKDIQVVFYICREKPDVSSIVEKYKASKIFFQVLSVSEITHRISYVDLIIELMLTKKL